MNITNAIKLFSRGFNSYGMNVISYLAQKGKDDEVDHLIAEEAGGIADAIYGYALAGNDHQVEKLLAMVDSTDKTKLNICIGQLIRGYAREGYLSKLYKLSNYKDYISDYLVGLAQAGDKYKVTNLLDRNISLFSSAVEGYASTNNFELLSKLIRGTACYPLAIYNAAKAGQTGLVNDLLLQCGIEYKDKVSPSLTGHFPEKIASYKDINDYSYLNKAMEGYMFGLHFTDAIALLERGASITLCINELRDNHGLPSKDLYLAFLAHIQDPLLRDKVLTQMRMSSMAMEGLEITENDLVELYKITDCMVREKLNYIDALAKITEPKNVLVGGEISLSYLADVLCKESSVSGLKPAP